MQKDDILNFQTNLSKIIKEIELKKSIKDQKKEPLSFEQRLKKLQKGQNEQKS